MSWILFLQKIHGHIGLLGIALAFHPVLALRPNRGISSRTRLAGWLATFFAVLMNGLGWWIYPAYREEIKRDFYLANRLYGDAFEVKEHLAYHSLLLALAGGILISIARGPEARHYIQAIRACYGASAILALVVGGLGIWLSSVKGFAYPL